MKIALIIVVLMALGVAPAQAAIDATRVESSVRAMMAERPASTLRDIYKSAFQDRFGPGHITPTAERCRAGIEYELARPLNDEPAYFAQPTIPDSTFVRADLRLIRDGILPIDDFIAAVLDGALPMPSEAEVAAWAADWHDMLAVIRSMGLDRLPDFDADAARIDAALSGGDFTGEHSEAFMDAYNVHYRLIRTDIYQSRIMPLLQQQGK